MFLSGDSCQNRVSAEQYHMAVSRAHVLIHRVCVFMNLSADKLLLFKYSLAQVQFFFNAQEIKLFF